MSSKLIFLTGVGAGAACNQFYNLRSGYLGEYTPIKADIIGANPMLRRSWLFDTCVSFDNTGHYLFSIRPMILPKEGKEANYRKD